MEINKDVICTYCGCVCDDLEIQTEGQQVLATKYACAVANEKFLVCQKERNIDSLLRVGGDLVKAGLDETIERAAQILAAARYPLLYGWSNTSCETIKVGLELAEVVGGLIDNTSSVCHGPGIEAVQEIGEVSSTLGQIRHRADLVIYWGCNPNSGHIRHMSRYTLARGRFRSSRRDRKVIVVDVRGTPTSKAGDEFIKLEPGGDFEFLTALRMAIRDEELEVEKVAGVPVSKIEELADLMVNAQFGVLFFGLGLTMSRGKCENVAAALSLVDELNSRTKFVLMPMRGHHNVTGANKVFTWQTGYPFAVDFSHGYPRYNPGETSSVDSLVRGDFDAALVVASDPAANFPKSAVVNLSRIPLVVVDPSLSATALLADVVIPVAFLGVECPGTIYRMDGVPFNTKKIVEPPSNCLSDTVILQRILMRVKELKGV